MIVNKTPWQEERRRSKLEVKSQGAHTKKKKSINIQFVNIIELGTRPDGCSPLLFNLSMCRKGYKDTSPRLLMTKEKLLLSVSSWSCGSADRSRAHAIAVFLCRRSRRRRRTGSSSFFFFWTGKETKVPRSLNEDIYDLIFDRDVIVVDSQ